MSERGQAREVVDAMKALLATPGWEMLANLLQVQIDNRSQYCLRKQIGSPVVEDGNTYIFTAEMQEFMKGEITALEMFLNVPKREIDINEDFLQGLKQGEDDDNKE